MEEIVSLEVVWWLLDNVSDQIDDYDMMSVGVKVYDDGVTDDPVERRE